MYFRLLVFLFFGFSLFAQELPLDDFIRELSVRQGRVEEFRFIRKAARELGIKNVYMFGGTAAAWAHYVRWDMRRELGIEKLQSERFDYDFTNIFRSNQDFDVVIDAGLEAAEKLESVIQEKFQYFSGDRPTWEVRLLNETRADKDPILGPDFQNQHTDSHSTGLIEMMNCQGFDCVKDIRSMNQKNSQFLLDVYEAKLHYYFSKKHHTTSRFIKGMNPEILSVVRYFTKAFQYKLKQRVEDIKKIEMLISEFNPSDKQIWDPYVIRWLEKNAKKLIVNAVDVEYAQEVLEKTGLKNKLLALGDTESIGSMTWWLNKEALKTKPLGQGLGKKASEIFSANEHGDIIISHETNNFSAFEGITKSHSGMANVLISRSKANGEDAAYGDGHYTKLGLTGAKGTGLTIRYKLNPDARVDSDFTIHNDGRYILINNKAAIEVIYENLDYGVVEYFDQIANGLVFDFNDKGVVEKLKRRINRKSNQISTSEKEEIIKLIDIGIENKKIQSSGLLDVLSQSWILNEYTEYWFVYASYFADSFNNLRDLAENILLNEDVLKLAVVEEDKWFKLIRKCIENESGSWDIANQVLLHEKVKLNQKIWRELLSVYLENNQTVWGLLAVFSDPDVRREKELLHNWIEKYIENGNDLEVLAEEVLSHKTIVSEKETFISFIKFYIDQNIRNVDYSLISLKYNMHYLAENVLSLNQAVSYGDEYLELIDMFLDVKYAPYESIAEFVLSKPEVIALGDRWAELVEKYIEIGRLDDLAVYVLSKPESIALGDTWVDLIELFIAEGKNYIGYSETETTQAEKTLIENVFSKKEAIELSKKNSRFKKIYDSLICDGFFL